MTDCPLEFQVLIRLSRLLVALVGMVLRVALRVLGMPQFRVAQALLGLVTLVGPPLAYVVLRLVALLPLEVVEPRRRVHRACLVLVPLGFLPPPWVIPDVMLWPLAYEFPYTLRWIPAREIVSHPLLLGPRLARELLRLVPVLIPRLPWLPPTVRGINALHDRPVPAWVRTVLVVGVVLRAEQILQEHSLSR